LPSASSLFSRWLPITLITLAALWLRTHDLGRRPMHADEANQAVKLGELLDAGHYAFDPRDHHGPTLYFAAVPIAWMRGERSLATLTETTVRLVPALFGTAAVVLLAALASPLGRWPALVAAAFLAVSPTAVYYSRYFVQETLLLTFTLTALLCARTWWRVGHTRWAVLTGACIGLMQATKATAPLFMVLAIVAALTTYDWKRAASELAPKQPTRWHSRRRYAAFAVLAAFLTAGLLYSSFGTQPGGLRDALGAYTHAFTRFSSEAGPTGHEKPWWYYLRLFGWFRQGGLVWHQVAFAALAVAGLVVAFVRHERFLRGVAVYTVLVTAAFSLFAYKTPWQAVHLVPGIALLAAGSIAAIARLNTGRLVAAAFTLITIATLFQQTWRAAFLRPADQRNPYAYVHSSADILKYRALAEAAVARTPGQPIRVIAEEYWPLPWYLRGLPGVGFWSAPPEDCDGALVITSSNQAEAVRAKLRGRYRETFLGLRPGVICILFTPES
jgi:uncharacterized protein (TIGR03663 family)